jgi:hypothetical protein
LSLRLTRSPSIAKAIGSRMERTVKRYDTTSSTVQGAGLSVSESILDDLDITDAERAHLIALLARRKPRRLRPVCV